MTEASNNINYENVEEIYCKPSTNQKIIHYNAKMELSRKKIANLQETGGLNIPMFKFKRLNMTGSEAASPTIV